MKGMEGSNPTTHYLTKGRASGSGTASQVAAGSRGWVGSSVMGSKTHDRDAGSKRFDVTRKSLNHGRKM